MSYGTACGDESMRPPYIMRTENKPKTHRTHSTRHRHRHSHYTCQQTLLLSLSRLIHVVMYWLAKIFLDRVSVTAYIRTQTSKCTNTVQRYMWSFGCLFQSLADSAPQIFSDPLISWPLISDINCRIVWARCRENNTPWPRSFKQRQHSDGAVTHGLDAILLTPEYATQCNNWRITHS